MKRNIIGLAVLTVMLISSSTAFPAGSPGPFGLAVGKTLPTKIVKNPQNAQLGLPGV